MRTSTHIEASKAMNYEPRTRSSFILYFAPSHWVYYCRLKFTEERTKFNYILLACSVPISRKRYNLNSTLSEL